jgi:putative oxidoreductase
MLSAIFVINGVRAAANPGPYVDRARLVTDRVTPLLEKTDLHLPTDAKTLVRITGAVQAVAGLMLTTGHLTRPAAATLAGTLIPTTLAGHPFWRAHDPAERASQRIQFLKNLGLLGGLLLAAADTQGRPGLRWRTSHAVGGGRRTVRRAVHTARRDARIAMRSASAGRKLPG